VTKWVLHCSGELERLEKLRDTAGTGGLSKNGRYTYSCQKKKRANAAMVTYFQAYFKTGCKEFTNNSSTCQLGVSAVCCKLWPFQDTFNFNRDHSDRGWHKGFVKAMHSARDSCFYIVTSFRDQRNCLPALNLHTDSVPSPAKLFQVVPSCAKLLGVLLQGFLSGA
jgi:hypothetical protein